MAPVADRGLSPQVPDSLRHGTFASASMGGCAVGLGMNPIVTLEKQRLNMIRKLV
jgi:hypothetical protein